MKQGPERELLERYAGRAEKAGRQLGLSGPDITEWNESRASTAKLRCDDEASQMLASLRSGAMVIALDENGTDLTSPQLAATIGKAMDAGTPEIGFAIGGPDGHGEALLARADLRLRMGRMTWPHQIARVMVSEQLYRAITILSGHPYHRV